MTKFRFLLLKAINLGSSQPCLQCSWAVCGGGSAGSSNMFTSSLPDNDALSSKVIVPPYSVITLLWLCYSFGEYKVLSFGNSLMNNGVEYLFICLLAIWIPSSVKCLLLSFTYFDLKKNYFVFYFLYLFCLVYMYTHIVVMYTWCIYSLLICELFMLLNFCVSSDKHTFTF